MIDFLIPVILTSIPWFCLYRKERGKRIQAEETLRASNVGRSHSEIQIEYAQEGFQLPTEFTLQEKKERRNSTIGRLTIEKQDYFVKYLIDGKKTSAILQNLYRKKKFIEELSFPKIYFISTRQECYVTEYLTGTTINERIEKNTWKSEAQKDYAAYCYTKFVAQAHKKNYCLSDMNWKNVIFDSETLSIRVVDPDMFSTVNELNDTNHFAYTYGTIVFLSAGFFRKVDPDYYFSTYDEAQSVALMLDNLYNGSTLFSRYLEESHTKGLTVAAIEERHKPQVIQYQMLKEGFCPKDRIALLPKPLREPVRRLITQGVDAHIAVGELAEILEQITYPYEKG